MFERMLDKENKPTIEVMGNYCGNLEELFVELNEWIKSMGSAEEIVFPYGKRYGWGIKHQIKNQLICNVFPEANSFTVMFRLTNEQFDSIYHNVRRETQILIDNKYPCSNGGWIHFRITSEKDYDDMKKLLAVKLKKRSN